jgi:hypothetical protein
MNVPEIMASGPTATQVLPPIPPQPNTILQPVYIQASPQKQTSVEWGVFKGLFAFFILLPMTILFVLVGMGTCASETGTPSVQSQQAQTRQQGQARQADQTTRGEQTNTASIDGLFGIDLGSPLPHTCSIVEPVRDHIIKVIPPLQPVRFTQCDVTLTSNDTIVNSIESVASFDDEAAATKVLNALTANFMQRYGKPKENVNLPDFQLRQWQVKTRGLSVSLRNDYKPLVGKKATYYVTISCSENGSN